MKKLISAFLCIVLLLVSTSVFASPKGYDSTKIEQVYSKLPEVKVYLKTSEPVESGEIAGYLNSEELTLTDHHAYDRNDGVSFIFMFDCSSSVRTAQMNAIKNTVVDFVENKSLANDKFTIVTFGEKIDIIADGTNTKEEVASAVKSMKNNQAITVLYDAVDAVKQISDKADNTYPKKCMCVIFTDAVNDNLGGTTDDEVLKAARATGVPVYAVAINPNDKASIDSLGEISRASGGELCVATGGNIAKAFDKALAELSTLYEITFTTKTNKTVIGENNISICIGDKSEGNVAERKFQSTSWAVDNEAPYIASYKLVSDKELLLKFNEPVENAGKVENYTVKKGGSTYKIKDARYDESTNTVLLSFSEYLSNGTYKIKTSNITDSSMEENALSSTYKFKRSGFAGFFAGVKNFLFTNYGWIIVLVVILVLAFVTHKIIKKRKGIVMLDNKATFGDNISYEHTAPKALPSHYLKLTMETADGAITNMDINIVQSIIFGRADSCEVTIDDANLSRQHFAIELEDGMLFIQNLSQTNGTLLNGVQLLSKRKLELGDVISAGQERFTVSKI